MTRRRFISEIASTLEEVWRMLSCIDLPTKVSEPCRRLIIVELGVAESDGGRGEDQWEDDGVQPCMQWFGLRSVAFPGRTMSSLIILQQESAYSGESNGFSMLCSPRRCCGMGNVSHGQMSEDPHENGG